ncbi:MAG: S8 family serine peptidase [Bacteroidota bacterium]
MKKMMLNSSANPLAIFSNRKLFLLAFLILALSCNKTVQSPDTGTSRSPDPAFKGNGYIGINVLLSEEPGTDILKDLGAYGTVLKVFPEIKALTMKVPGDKLPVIKSLSYVRAANPDAVRQGSPVDAVPVSNFTTGLNTWNLDAVNVTDLNAGRSVAEDGEGVYVGVLDTGLPDSWRQYFPEERIATQYAKSFGGGGGENGNVSEQPNKWEHDQSTHGGHVTSTIIGYKFGSAYFNGVAPKATIIPVKILNQNGSGWSSVIAEGIVYIAKLKDGELSENPVIINMSLGGPVLDAVESAALDYAISKGVIIIASAGNSGAAGMGYPGAYKPVISVAAAGWKSEFSTPDWWYNLDVAEPTDVSDFYLAGFSSRQLTGQDLDVTAPGVYIVGPYQFNSGQLTYAFLRGTSMASPHVAGIIALMLQKKASLTPAEVETILESVALPMSEGANAAGSGFITASAALSGL